MRKLTAALILSLGLSAPAFADTIAVLKENTLLLHEESGRMYTVLVSDGGTLSQVNSAGMQATGVWAIEDRGFCWQARGAAKLCITLRRPTRAWATPGRFAGRRAGCPGRPKSLPDGPISRLQGLQ